MLTQRRRLWIVQSASMARFAAALVFAALAFQPIPVAYVMGCYVFAMASDLVDGFLARRLDAATYFGRVVDLVSDKSLTIVSLMYAAARGISLLPLAAIGAREVAVIGLRLVTVRQTELLTTSRLFGGVMAFVLWANTLFLILTGTGSRRLIAIQVIYWACAFVVAINLVLRLVSARGRIKESLGIE